MQGLFTFIDLFAGIGGMRIPFEDRGGTCLFTAERDKFARRTYEANFINSPHHSFTNNIVPCAAKPEVIPKHDILLAGFPCQPFSQAGVSKRNSLGRPHGFKCDDQGNLFYSIASILDHHRPVAFLLENVKNLERHDKGRTFARMREVLEVELGYHISFKVINALPWVPQSRERIFIAGFSKPCTFSFDLMEIPAEGPVLDDILDRPEDVPNKYTLTENLWAYLQDYKAKHRAKGNGFGYSLVGPHDVSRTLSARYGKDGSEILIKQPWREDGRPRRLTPRECARLMGFDIGDRHWHIPVSDTQAYKQFGNAVVVSVVDAIAKVLIQ